jgi:hypothetical protein
MTETSDYTFAAYSLAGVDFPAQTISFTWANPPPADTLIGLYNVQTFNQHPDPITGAFAPGDYFNSTYVNLLTGSVATDAFGTFTETGPQSYGFTDVLPWAGGELEVTSQTLVYVPVGGDPHSVPEPAMMALMPVALGIAYLVARWRARMV